MARSRRRLIVSAFTLAVIAAVAAAGFIYLRGTRGPSSPEESRTAQAGGPVAPASTATSPQAGQPKPAGEGEETKRAPVPVTAQTLVAGPVSSYITSTANLITENEVKLLAEAEGRLAELRAEEGMRVAAGQAMATLAREDAEIALNKAEVRAGNARLAHERATKAIAEDLLSRETFDKVAMEKDIAEQEVAEARWKLQKTTIRAPFAGRVTERAVKLGQHVRLGDVLFTVADLGPLIARIYLPEKDVYGLGEGREVRITLKANEALSFGGRIRQISPVVDTSTGTVKVTIEAAAVPADVRPGAFVTIDIVRETHQRAVLLPRGAILRELQESYVFVAKGDVAEKRQVTLGLEEGDHVEALSGVAAGDQVIVAGQGALKDGAAIKIVPPSATTRLSPAEGQPARG